MTSFDSYAKTLDSQINVVRKKFDSALYMNEELKMKQKDILERELEKVRTTFANMDKFARSQPDASVLIMKLQRYRHEIDQIEKDVSRIFPLENVNQTMQQTFETKKADQRTRLLEGHERIVETGNTLNQTHAVALETERIGETTLAELENQRRMIEGGITDIDKVDDEVDSIRSTLTSMGTRLFTDRGILIGIIVVLSLAIAFVIGWRWIRPLIEKKA
uniref:t-SNARE coiled-coil homology domain-containing protein n=1 Tax=Arcella intermedia TaxID=1963864 RepID=A0A6B2LHM4_9EUKA|eukprot:TRINITY_DN9110_c0_g1_i1.p1 TRINITY_DN9110_c0_g1~~TRINITY_DN9110_c0_g1_i1.p1  ORF type:complete len:219 (-),score=31.84 TRINITY_DN9110_c0_g1_i1:109-765(-)